jgi:adenine-specific DNA-methyltransferase
MASMFDRVPETANLLDAGAGVGSLTAAYLTRILDIERKPKSINAILYELDSFMIQGLQKTLLECQKLCERAEIHFEWEIRQQDFIAASVELIKSQNSFLPLNFISYDCAILNPPYHKINSNSKTRRLLRSIGIETTNLYTAFLWLTTKQLAHDGEIVAIVPRSFCNGTYFRTFRIEFLRHMSIRRVHVFESRKQTFKEGDVLQENIILHVIKNESRRSNVIISSSVDPNDEGLVFREVDYDQIVQPNDPDKFIRIVPDQLGHKIKQQMDNLRTTLKDLGLTVSTGRVVDFRARSLLRDQPDKEIIPLIYPSNFANGFIVWPRDNNNKKKPSALAIHPDVDDLVIPANVYVLVKRFSSKEEKKRISSAVYDPNRISAARIGFENHLNYFHRRYGSLSITLAKGLALYLNSTLVDEYFRQFSGHTQINATDLRNLKYPTEAQLISLGEKVGKNYPDQDEIDRIVMEELALADQDKNIPDPIRAKKRIREALSILHILGLPRNQQNDRSALTLLALLGMRANTLWDDASMPQMGITEMMGFFRDFYGIRYAPNTRETVRRQTVHQFMQAGLAIANPDNPSRLINSPKTKYQIEPSALKLLRTFGTDAWEGNLHQYLKAANQLAALQLREREMTLIPVILPDGVQIMLSAGGQNELIKQVIEEFCPRFTPAGKVIYVGDAGEKLNEHEVIYFEMLGIKVDKHGKMPDVIVHMPDKDWLVLIEAVTSHGPIDVKRHNELQELFKGSQAGLVYVTAFETRKTLLKYLQEIDWETEVWVAESPSHIIHFNGERFLGPYK